MKNLALVLAMCCISLFCTAQTYPEVIYNEYPVEFNLEPMEFDDYNNLSLDNPFDFYDYDNEYRNPFDVGDDVIYQSNYLNFYHRENAELLNFFLWNAIENYNDPEPVINVEVNIENIIEVNY